MIIALNTYLTSYSGVHGNTVSYELFNSLAQVKEKRHPTVYTI